jgi:hypothetical protein
MRKNWYSREEPLRGFACTVLGNRKKLQIPRLRFGMTKERVVERERTVVREVVASSLASVAPTGTAMDTLDVTSG